MCAAAVGTELRELLDSVVERRGAWREERAAKTGDHTSKREILVQETLTKILADPPKEQISRDYIAKVAGLGEDVLKDNRYLSELCRDTIESKEDWFKRRFITAFHNKPTTVKRYSSQMICRLADIDGKTYKKHKKLFDEWLDRLSKEQVL
jgi:hypothetical protein